MGIFFKNYIFEFKVILENGKVIEGSKKAFGTVFSDYSNIHDEIRNEMCKNVGSNVKSFIRFKTIEV